MEDDFDALDSIEMPYVQVTDPDGNTFEFRYVAALENAGKTYVLLNDAQADERGEEQLVAIRLEMTADGVPEYVLPMDPQEIEAVMDRYMWEIMESGREERSLPS